MNIHAYDRWIFTKIHEHLLKDYNHDLPTRTLRNIIGQMVIDNIIDETLLRNLEKSEDKNNPVLKEITKELAEYLHDDDYLSYSTSIRITQGTKDKLLQLKSNPNETYEDVIVRLLS